MHCTDATHLGQGVHVMVEALHEQADAGLATDVLVIGIVRGLNGYGKHPDQSGLLLTMAYAGRRDRLRQSPAHPAWIVQRNQSPDVSRQAFTSSK